MKNRKLLALAEQAVYKDLRQAVIFAAFVKEDVIRDNYQEYSIYAAWENDKEFGTHRVQVNSDGETMCVIGHYFRNADDALTSLLERARIKQPA